MVLTRDELFEKIYNSYCVWYDMERCGDEREPLAALGQFHETDKSYMLVEKAQLWVSQSKDFLYVYTLPVLTEELFRELVSQAKQLGEQLIRPAKYHRSSYITALFICDEAEKSAVKALTGYRFRRDFAFGFRGWEEVHTALVTAADGSVRTNGDGRNTAKFLKKIIQPK